MGIEFVSQDEKVAKMDSGDSCTTYILNIS